MRLKFRSALLGVAVVMGLVLASSVVQPQTIRVLSLDSGPKESLWMKEMVAEFEKENPGVKVEMEWMGWQELTTRLMADVAGGTEPEAIQQIQGGNVAYYQKLGLFLPVTDIIDKLGRDDYMEGHLLEMEGEDYLVPVSNFASGLWYRADLFADKGLVPPRTWEDLLEVAEILTEDTDGDGTIDRWGYCMALGDTRWTSQNLVLYYWTNGGKVFDKDFNIAFDKPPYRQLMIETFEFYKKLSKYTPPGSVDYAWWESINAFSTGVVAMNPYFARQLSVVNENNPELAPYTYVTFHPYPKDKKIRCSMADTSGWSIMKNSDNPELVKKLILFVFRRDRHIERLHIHPGMSNPCQYSIWQSEEFQDHPFVKRHLADIRILVNSREFGAYWPAEWTRETGRINWVADRLFNSPIMTDMVKGVILFNKDVEKAIDEAAKKARELVAKQRELLKGLGQE